MGLVVDTPSLSPGKGKGCDSRFDERHVVVPAVLLCL